MKKRSLAAVLALVMALTLLPGPVLAADADETANYSYTVKKNGTGPDLRRTDPGVVSFDHPVTWGEPSSEVISLTVQNTGNRTLDLHFSGKMLTCFDVRWESSSDAHVTIGVGDSAILLISPKADTPVDYYNSLLLMETNSRRGWSLQVDLTTTAKAVTVRVDKAEKEYGQTLTSEQIGVTVTDDIPLSDMGVALMSQGFDAAATVGTYPITLDLSNASSNYNVTLSGSPVVTVSRATPEPVAVNAGCLLTGFALSQASLTGQYQNPYTGESVEGDFAWVDGDKIMTESGEAAYTFTPKDTANYNPVTATVPVTVSDKLPTEITPVESSLNVTYNGQPQYVQFTVTPAERAGVLKVEYKLRDSEVWTETIGKDVGIYDVRASLDETAVYAPGEVTAVLTVSEKPVKFYLPTSGVEQALVKNKYYDGNTTATVDTAYFTANNKLDKIFISGDDVKFNYNAITAVFASPNKGLQTVTVTIDGSKALLGTDAKNYLVSNTEVTSKSQIYELPSGGGGRSTPDPKPATSLTPDITVDKNGEAKVSIGDQVLSDAVSDAKAGKTGEIVIAPQVEGDAGKVTVELPKSSLSDVAKETDVAVTVKTELGSVTLPNGSLGELADRSGDTVTVSVEKSGGDAVSITVQVGESVVDHLNGGLRVAFPDPGQGNVLVAIQPDGGQVVIKKSLLSDGLAAALLGGSATVALRDNSMEFSDIPAGAWYTDIVDFASSHELLTGTADGVFSPDIPMTRAMLATVLWSLEDKESVSNRLPFADVSDRQWFAQAVGWANATGIVQGYGNDLFRPNDSVVREQMALMLYRYAQQMGLDTSVRGSLSAYTDGGQVSSWASDAMAWAVGTGLMTGRGKGLLNPSDSITRAEVAAMVQRLIGLMVQ